MADPPRLTKLGAKWVEVKSGGLKASVSGMTRALLKRGQQHPLKHRPLQA